MESDPRMAAHTKPPTKYLIIWYDRREKPRKKRRFSFTIKLVPKMYRTSFKTAMKWAKGYLSTKYKVPLESVNVEEMYGGMRK